MMLFHIFYPTFLHLKRMDYDFIALALYYQQQIIVVLPFFNHLGSLKKVFYEIHYGIMNLISIVIKYF